MSSTYYEDPAILAEYLFFHYGKKEDYCPFDFPQKEAWGFPQRVVEVGMKSAGLTSGSRALDVGCAVGGASFALSPYFEEVLAFDYSSLFVESAVRIQKEKKMSISILQEVGRHREVKIELPQGSCPERIRFFQGDALDLKQEWGEFDLVLASNLIDRLSDPELFLKQIGRFVKKEGYLFLASPYTWMKSFTPPEKWLNQGQDNLDALKMILGNEFLFRNRCDVPMLIREHYRKYQWTICELSIWFKK